MNTNTFKGRGIVLSESFSGEADKIITVLFKEHGKLRLSARGARKPNSEFFAAARLFTYGDYVIYKGRGFYSVAQCSPIYHFPGVASDYAKMCYGSYLLEFTQNAVADQLACDDILYLLIKGLKELEKDRMPCKLVKAVFLLKFMALSGFEPETGGCVVCGRYEGLCLGRYGFICRACKQTGDEPGISADTARAIIYVLEKDIKDVFSFTAGDRVIEEMDRAAVYFMRNHLDICTKSEKFL